MARHMAKTFHHAAMYANERTTATQEPMLQADHNPPPAASALRDTAVGSAGQLSRHTAMRNSRPTPSSRSVHYGSLPKDAS